MSNQTIIKGKPLKEWVNAPYGAFTKAVREEIDPNYGIDIAVREVREWSVQVDYAYSGRGTAYYTITARNEKEAEELAMKKFDDDCPDFDDADIDHWDVYVERAKV